MRTEKNQFLQQVGRMVVDEGAYMCSNLLLETFGYEPMENTSAMFMMMTVTVH